MRAFFCGLPLDTAAASAPNSFWKAVSAWFLSSSRSQTKVARRRELGKRPRVACEARHTVALDEEVTVGGVGQRHIETLAGGVGLRLLETMRWRQVLGLGLD